MGSWEEQVRQFLLEEEEEDDELFFVLVPAVILYLLEMEEEEEEEMPVHTSSLSESPESSEVSQKAISPLLPVGSTIRRKCCYRKSELHLNSASGSTSSSCTSPALPTPALVERSNPEQSFHNDLSHFDTNPFASSFDGQETSSAHNEPNEAQSAPSNEESASGKKRKQSHIGSAYEGYVELKKSQMTKTLEALDQKRRHDEEFSIKKCLDKVDAMDELTDEEKSYALELFESEINREMFMKTKNHNVQLIWLKRKIRVLSGRNG